MRTLLTLTLALCSLVGTWSFGCARQSKWKNTVPENFHIEYQCSQEMYKYSIEIGPGSSGEIVYRPVEPSEVLGLGEWNLPVWTEKFTVGNEDLGRLYQLMSSRSVFKNTWKEDSSYSLIGGRAERMQVTGYGESITVGVDLKPRDREAIRDVYDSINFLVPETLWGRVKSKYQQYTEDYRRFEPAHDVVEAVVIGGRKQDPWDLFSVRVMEEMDKEDLTEEAVLGRYTSFFKKKFGDCKLKDFEFVFHGDPAAEPPRSGKVTILFKGNPALDLRVIRSQEKDEYHPVEEWRLDELLGPQVDP